MAPRDPSLLTIVPLFLFFLFTSSLHDNLLFANAQSYTPEASAAPATAFIDGKVMYVHGGFIGSEQMTAQVFSLDLSTSWDVATPAYKQLPNGIKTGWHTGTLLNDSTTFLILAESSFYYYNIHNGQLTGYNISNSLVNATFSGGKAVTNPRTGRVYVPYGHYVYPGDVFSLLRFDPDAKKIELMSLPVSQPSVVQYSAAWSDYLDAMLMFGGFSTVGSKGVPISSLFRYNYIDSTWTSIPTTGTSPSARLGACFTPVSGGRKMILFGGDANADVTLNDIYVLDVTTWQWTRGPDSSNTRSAAACGASTSSDMFVAWGGYYRNSSMNFFNTSSNSPSMVTVYNLKSNTWVDRFTYTPPSPPTGGSNLGGIIGGIAAGCVVLCGILYAVHRNRKVKFTKPGNDVALEGRSFLGDPKPPAHITTIVTASAQQKPSYAHGQPVASMPVAFTPQPPSLLLRPSVAPPPAPIPASNYYQQHTQHTPCQIPIVSPQIANYQQHQNRQQQPHQQQFQYEQGQREQMKREQELEQLRVEEAQLEEELVLERQIEEQMTRLQTLKGRRQASDGSPVPRERFTRGPQAGFTTTMPDNARRLPPRAKPRYIQPVVSDEYEDQPTGPRSPQQPKLVQTRNVKFGA